MIKVKHITLEGFGSFITPFSYDFQDKGLTIIKGENGSGKTTMINGLCWVWFGETLKPKASVTTWEHEQPEDFQGTKGSVTFLRDDEVIEIIRCQDYKGKVFDRKGKDNLYIIKDGEEFHVEGGKREKQKYIDGLLGLSFTLFKHSITFGQKLSRFVEEDGATKKKILEELFEVDFINNIRDKVDADIKRNKEGLDEVWKKKIEIEADLKAKEDLLVELLKYEKADKVNKQKEIDLSQGIIDDTQLELDNANKNFDEKEGLTLKFQIDGYEKQIKRITEEYNSQLVWEKGKLVTIQSKIDQWKKDDKRNSKLLQDENDNLLQLKNHKCPLCDQHIQPLKLKTLTSESNDRIEKIKEDLREGTEFMKKEVAKEKPIREQLNKLEIKYNKDIANINKLLEAAKNKQLIYSNQEKIIDNLKWKIDNELKHLNSLKNKANKTKSISVKLSVMKLRKEHKPLKITFNNLTTKIENLKWLYSNPLSNNGIKTFIFDSQLSRVNRQLKIYSKYIGFYPKIEVDMESSRKDIIVNLYKDKNLIPFPDLSGGQGQLVNVIIAFAQNDIFTENKPINILFLDEIFEHLSQTNIEKVTDIVLDKSKNLSVLLVTHIDTFNPFNSKSITFKLEQGNTRLVKN